MLLLSAMPSSQIVVQRNVSSRDVLMRLFHFAENSRLTFFLPRSLLVQTTYQMFRLITDIDPTLSLIAA